MRFFLAGSRRHVKRFWVVDWRKMRRSVTLKSKPRNPRNEFVAHDISLKPIGPHSSLNRYLSASLQSDVIAFVATPLLRSDSGTTISSIWATMGESLPESG